MADLQGGIDASIPLQAGRGIEQPNPLKQIGEFAGIQNALNAAKLNPGALELQRQAIQVGASTSKRTVNQVAYQNLTDLLAPGADLSIGNVTSRLASIEHNLGIPTGGILPDIIQATTNGDPATADQRLRRLIATRAMVSPESSVGVVIGAPGTRGTGLGTESGVVAGALEGGGFKPDTVTPIVPSLSERMQRVPGPPGPGGAPTTVPIGAVTPPAFLGGISMGTTGRNPNVPPALRNPNAPPPAASPDAIPGQITTGVGPEEERRLAETGGAVGKGFQAISDEGTQAVPQKALLGTARQELAGFISGSNVGKSLEYQRFIQSWAPQLAAGLGIDPKRIRSQEAFEKIVNQLANAPGAGSNDRLHVQQASNPNSYQSPEGLDFIIRQLEGNEDYKIARQQYADKWGDKRDLQGFNASVTKNLDPRVFQYERLNSEQKKDYFDGLIDKKHPEDTKERDAFKRSHAWALRNNLIGGTNAGQ